MKGRETQTLRGARPGVQVRRAVRQSDGLARLGTGHRMFVQLCGREPALWLQECTTLIR